MVPLSPSAVRSHPFQVAALAGVLMLAAACGPADQGIETPTRTSRPPTAAPGPAASSSEPPTASPSPPTPTPTPTCQGEPGRLDRSQYPSPLLASEVPVWVYLPACYPELSGPLPTVYLLHGKPFDEEHWISLGLLQAYEDGVAQGRWGRALLVLPRLPEPLFSRTDGGAGSYEQEFLEGLLPYIESRYPAVVAQDPDRRLAGISRGGIWALELGLLHPDQFRAVAALSPSLAVNYPRPAYDPFELAAAGAGQPAKVLLLAGQDDWARPGTERLAAVFGETPAGVDLEIVPGDHSDPTWAQALPSVLAFLLDESGP